MTEKVTSYHGNMNISLHHYTEKQRAQKAILKHTKGTDPKISELFSAKFLTH